MRNNPEQFFSQAGLKDMAVLIVLVVLVTWHPYFLHQKINLFELGLYLPGVDAVVQGQVPYRDFFHLRGPFELYLPAWLMQIFGMNVAVLAAYFYAGTVLTLICAVLIAKEVLSSRIFLWLFVPVLVARTFPRVVFTYWGGMRYVWGLLAVFCAVKFFKTRRAVWLILAGMLSAVGGLTSIEIGVAAFGATAGTLVLEMFVGGRAWRQQLKALGVLMAGVCAVTVPYLCYLYCQGALGAYAEAMHQVVTRMTQVFVQTEPVPSNIMETLAALVNPGNKNFRQMTPLYCLLVFVVYLVMKVRSRKISALDTGATVVAMYALLVYVGGFRNLWASVFEMALQPEKIVLFFMLERFFFYLKEQGNWKKTAYVFLVGVMLSSLIFSFTRFQKRFFAMQWFTKTLCLGKGKIKAMPLLGEKTEQLVLSRIRGMTVPETQARDLKELAGFFDKHTKIGEAVLMFPELGALNFILDRPFVGRFPVATLSWINDHWYGEWMQDVQAKQPAYAVVNKQMPEHFEKTYFQVAENRVKFEAQMKYIRENYHVIDATPSYNIYARNDQGP